MSKPATPWPRCDFSGVTTLGPCPCCGTEIGSAGWVLPGGAEVWCNFCPWHPNETHPKEQRS